MAQRRKRTAARGTSLPELPAWRWRTLPVWLALTGGFVLGWYVAAAGARISVETWAYITVLIVMAGFSAGLSRVVSRATALWVMRRKQRAEKRILSDPSSRR